MRLLRGYPNEVTAYTRGRGRLQLRVDGYRPCREQDALVRASGYDPARDLENPAGSIFCGLRRGLRGQMAGRGRRGLHLPLLRFGGPVKPAPQRIVRSVAPGGAPELEKGAAGDLERTYGAIRRRDVLPQMMPAARTSASSRKPRPGGRFRWSTATTSFRLGRAQGSSPAPASIPRGMCS